MGKNQKPLMNKKLSLIGNLTSKNVSIRLIFLAFNWMKFNIINIFKPDCIVSNILNLLDSKQNDKIIESEDAKIKSMAVKRFEIEVREKERPIHEKVLGALYERKIGVKVLDFHFLMQLLTNWK